MHDVPTEATCFSSNQFSLQYLLYVSETRIIAQLIHWGLYCKTSGFASSLLKPIY